MGAYHCTLTHYNCQYPYDTCARASREHVAHLTRSSRPQVREQGVIRLVQARHPILVLRGLEV